MAWQSANLLQNMPMWDEFETVLSFIMDLRASGSLGDSIATFFATANEHVVLTSRMIFIVLYEITGKVNFTHLAIAGNTFVLAAMVILGRQQNSRLFGWVCTAVGSLLIFQMQHYENLFSSYASIDHFQIVLLTTGCLLLLVRGGLRPTLFAGLLAALAVFTLAHGVAVLAAGAAVLYLRSSRRAFFLWLGFGAVLFVALLLRLGSETLAPPPHVGVLGIKPFVVYWLTMVGGIPALGNPTLAMLAGILVLGLFGWLLTRKSFVADPFLSALAINSIVACFLIAYGRVNSVGVPALSSRYMVQSAMIWASVLLLAVKMLPSERRVAIGSTLLVVLAAALNVAANVHFTEEADRFVQRRIDAARYYDERGTFVGLRLPIFPKPQKADVIVATAAREKIFEVRTERSREVVMPGSLTLYPIIFYFDKLALAANNLHVRGWMLTKEYVSTDLAPHLLLQEGGKSFLFRGFTELRPDVTKANPDRMDTDESGFYFVVPRESVPAGSYNLRVVLLGQRRALYNETKRQVIFPAATVPPTPAAALPSGVPPVPASPGTKPGN